MKLALLLATGVAALAVIATAAQRKARFPVEAASASASASFGRALPAAECPVGSLPDHGVCIPVPKLEPTVTEPRQAVGVPRRPDRPTELSRYVLPVDLLDPKQPPAGLPPLGGVLPETVEQRLLGIAIPTARGADVRMVALEGQKGEATIAYAGDLIGPTLITRHLVDQRDEQRVYLVFFGNLSTLPALKVGATIVTGTKIGDVGELLTPGEPRLYLELRQLRTDFDPQSSPPDEWLDPANTISVDIRNALTLTPKP